MDVLSDVISAMRTGQPSSNRLRIGSPWGYRFAPYNGAGFHVLLRGTCWLVPECASSPIPLGTGDAVLLPHGAAHVLSETAAPETTVPFETAESDPAGGTEFLCGKYRLDHARAHPLLAGLPEVVHIPARLGRHPQLRGAIDLLSGEIGGNRPGRETVVTGLLDLLLVYLVRAWLDEHPSAGWPGALHDPPIAAALEALHTDPSAAWRAEDLAAAAGLSRSTFTRRFSAYTGQSPVAYLTWWRMVGAARLLRDTELTLPAIASRVGYGSPYAFAHAFKRHCGVAPGRYRTDGAGGSERHGAGRTT